MGNYKGIKFNNTMEGFKRWNKEFPPMDKDAVKAQGFKREQIQDDTYYMELQLVQGFLSPDSKFISANIRKYDPESQNFEYVGIDKEKELIDTVFHSKIGSFREKHNAPFYK